jgi:hypothetical protein
MSTCSPRGRRGHRRSCGNANAKEEGSRWEMTMTVKRKPKLMDVMAKTVAASQAALLLPLLQIMRVIKISSTINKTQCV